MNEEIKYHQATVEYVSKELSTDTKVGLTNEESASRLKSFGYNRLDNLKKDNLILVLLHQFHNIMTYLLLVAAVLSFVFQDWLDGIAIIMVILVTGIIGFLMEWQAKKSMEALKKMVSNTAKIIRNGKLSEISSEFVVPGDLILVEAGDIIPADARLIQSSQLEVNESSLTGESLPIEKLEHQLPIETPLAERRNMLYNGSFATQGNGKAIVVATGMNTELGKIAGLVQSAEQGTTPLEKKIGLFSKKLILFTIAIVLLIFLFSLFNGGDWLSTLKTAIALAVAAIPEGLPIVATLALAQGMMKMTKKNVVVKKLAAVETLGGTTVICSDKTGTLTQNRVEVSVVDYPGDQIELKDFSKGELTQKDYSSQLNNQNYITLLRIAALCNTSEFYYSKNKEMAIGDPLETGLLKFVLKNDINVDELRVKFPKIKEIPFNSIDKVMATMHSYQNKNWVAVKGAPEAILNRCTQFTIADKQSNFDDTDKKLWLERSDYLAQKGLRVLAFASKDSSENDDLLNNLTFNGIIGFIDPPAEGVKEAIAECQNAGINVVMITGDHPSTAVTIAHKLGILEEYETNFISGQEMPSYENLTDQGKEQWFTTKVFARVSPSQKLDLVRVLQEKDNVVGMTGDGVNDAPALKKSDIGIAMGIRGTQVAQEAADMVLKDDSFSSIVSAIKQGRIIFDNIRKFVVYLLSCNLSEIMIVALIAFLGLPFQLLPIQILFLNLVTDVFPALALGVGKGEKGIMSELPRNPSEPIIMKKKWFSIWIYACIISICSLGVVYLSQYLIHSEEKLNSELSNNLVFFTLSIAQLLHVFNMSSIKTAFFNNDIMRNKFIWYAMAICSLILIAVYYFPVMKDVLSIQTIGVKDWLIILSAAFTSLVLNNILKKTKLIQ